LLKAEAPLKARERAGTLLPEEAAKLRNTRTEIARLNARVPGLRKRPIGDDGDDGGARPMPDVQVIEDGRLPDPDNVHHWVTGFTVVYAVDADMAPVYAGRALVYHLFDDAAALGINALAGADRATVRGAIDPDTGDPFLWLSESTRAARPLMSTLPTPFSAAAHPESPLPELLDIFPPAPQNTESRIGAGACRAAFDERELIAALARCGLCA
jgi:hypothetical protein